MGETLENFLFLCRCLSVDDSPDAVCALHEEIRTDRVDWQQIARLAADRFLTPALWVSLSRKGLGADLPENARDFLQYVHSLNVERNRNTKAGVLEIASSLNGVGVEPILLKGAIHLFDSAYGDFGARMMVDIDILIPETEIVQVLAALAKLGYRVDGDEIWTAHAYSHLYRPGEAWTLDVHRYLSFQRNIVAPADVQREAVPLETDRVRLLAPSPTHRLFHNMFHAQLQNQNYMLGLVSLMQLCDFAALARHHYNSVDWAWLVATAREHGLRRALEAYVHLAVKLLGLQRPSEITEGFRAKFHHWRCLAQLRHPLVSSFVQQLGVRTDVFTRLSVSTTYGCSMNPAVINFFRLHVAYRLLRGYRWEKGKLGRRRQRGVHRSR
jgi:Uncharacterised nucleotidyltransferase